MAAVAAIRRVLRLGPDVARVIQELLEVRRWTIAGDQISAPADSKAAHGKILAAIRGGRSTAAGNATAEYLATLGAKTQRRRRSDFEQAPYAR